MLRRIPDTELATYDVTATPDLIALSVLALDLEPPSIGGWDAYLAGRGIEVTVDDIGRSAIRRADARQLFDERREGQARQREATAQNDARLEKQRLAQLRPGVPADAIPDGVTPAAAMLQAGKDAAEPRRTSPLHEALAGDAVHCTFAGAVGADPYGGRVQHVELS
jgi:hypothetical protein